jgi:hypothetical protein
MLAAARESAQASVRAQRRELELVREPGVERESRQEWRAARLPALRRQVWGPVREPVARRASALELVESRVFAQRRGRQA